MSPFEFLAPVDKSPLAPNLMNLTEAIPNIESLLQEDKPMGIIYLDITRYGYLEGNFGQEVFDEIVSVTSELLQSFSGKLFRKEDRLLISEELGDVFIIVFSTTRSQEEITVDILQCLAQEIQDSLNTEIRKRLGGVIQQKVGYYAGYSILFPDSRVNPQRQIYRAVKEASRISFGKEQDDFEQKIAALRGTIRSKRLTSYFQPIVNFEPFALLGHELLTRGPGGARLVDSEMMFQIAQRGGLALDLERAARQTAIQTLGKHPLPGKIFLNSGPQVIMSPEFADLLIYESLGWDPSKIVIEITEGEAIKNTKEINRRLEIFRREGCKVAIDDVGKGNSGLYLLTELKPDYAKIDMALVRGIDQNELKQRLMQKLIEFSNSSDTQFIAEGVETVDEYKTLKRLGVKIGQGFLFGLPSPEPHSPEQMA